MMKLLLAVVLAYASLVVPSCLVAGVDAPNDSTVAPRFRWLKLGQVKPGGWIEAQMERDLREGFAGHLDQLAAEVRSDIFASGRNTPEKPNLATKEDKAPPWWNGESEGNWRAGYIMMAYLSGDTEAQRNADAYVRHILQTQDKDGYIGVYGPELRFSPRAQGELWTQTCMLRGLLAYYELTDKKEVLSAVERAVRLTMSKYGPGKGTDIAISRSAVGHNLMFVDVVERLYDLTGNTSYRDFGLWLYQRFCSSTPERFLDPDASLESLLDLQKPLLGHGATTIEQLRVPLWAYYVSGNPEFKQAYENAFIKVKRYLLPSGAVVSMEGIGGRKPDPTLTYYEFCTMKELLITFCSGLQKTGKGDFGDSIEKLLFNAAQGARAAGGKGVTYCTRDNRFRVAGDLKGRDKFSPTHSDCAVCCNPNAAQIMPLFVRGMWMRTPEDGLAAMLYGPSSVNTDVKGVKVRVEEKTDYPFSSVISFTVSPERPVDFPLRLRDPEWSKATRVRCEGAVVSREGDYFILRKAWNKGDEVTLELNEPIVGIEAANGEVALQRGPLVYALRIPGVPREIKTYSLPGFADLEYFPTQGACWSYALDSTHGNGDFGLTAKQDRDANMLHPYDGAPLRLEGRLINLQTGKKEDVSLIPMGSSLAALRRVTFAVEKPTQSVGGHLPSTNTQQ